MLVHGRPACRRHARMLAAVLADEFQSDRALPDLENRSPSLADYVGDALEPRVLALLENLRRPGSNDQVAAEPLHIYHPIAHPTAAGSRWWERTWKLFDHTGVLVKVSVEVDESRDIEVWVRVGRNLISHAVPPWIERRILGLPPLSGEEDRAARERFYVALWEPAVQPILTELGESLGSPHGYL